MAPSPHNKDLLPTDDETYSTSDANTDSLSEINDVTDDDASIFDDREQHPPEYYLNSTWLMLFLLKLLGRLGTPFAKDYCIDIII